MPPDPPFVRLDSPHHADWNCSGRADGLTLECDAVTGQAMLRHGGVTRRTWSDPLEALDWLAAFDVDRPASGGRLRWVGFIAYDFVRFLGELPRDRSTPTPYFRLSLTTDNPPPPLSAAGDAPPGRLLASNFTRARYESAVRTVIDYIAAGDVYQVNIAQQLRVATSASAGQLYSRLAAEPAEYAALLSYDDFQLISHSPELFFRVDSPDHSGRRRIVSRPIKGTRPRTNGMEQELRESEKDRAELAMIVDLQRNDLGRVCDIGSVRVTEPRVIEAHASVYHGVATIEGTLRRDVVFSQLLRAVFPCGSITGCPKIRAMQIIDELEPTPRGPYCGAIGYLADDGSMQFNVAIRTMTLRDRIATVPVGGGVIADSSPAGEYEETLVKARSMLMGLGIHPEAELKFQRGVQ